jgi:hypothetical protein
MQKTIKISIDFYINSSIHVAFAVFSLVQLTHFIFKIENLNVALFAFFGTIVGYNFVKYDALARAKNLQMSVQLKSIAILSFVSFIATGYYFFQLEKTTQIVGVFVFILTLLYTVPFFPNTKNARNWAGIKIYIVALCWVGVTAFLPILNADIVLENSIFILAAERFILVFVLILIFEILDLKHDDIHLQTVPQQIGVTRTKKVGYTLLVLFVALEFLKASIEMRVILLKLGIALTVFCFLFFASEKKSKYYSTFWVESIPIFWWVLVLVFS